MVLEKFRENDPAYASLVERLTAMTGAGSATESIHLLIQKATAVHAKEAAWQAPVLEGLARGMENRKSPFPVSEPDQRLLVKTFFESHSEPLRRASLQMLRINGISGESLKAASVAKAVLIIKDSALPEGKRAEAIDFLTLGDPSAQVSMLEKLLVPQEQPAVQLAVLRTLNQVPSNNVSEYLIRQWPVLTTEIREAAIGVLMANPERSALLIDALEKGKILTSSVSFDRSVSLMMMKDESLRNRARLYLRKTKRRQKKLIKPIRQHLI